MGVPEPFPSTTMCRTCLPRSEPLCRPDWPAAPAAVASASASEKAARVVGVMARLPPQKKKTARRPDCQKVHRKGERTLVAVAAARRTAGRRRRLRFRFRLRLRLRFRLRFRLARLRRRRALLGVVGEIPARALQLEAAARNDLA